MSNIGKICPKCRIELRPKEIGACVLEMATFGPIALYSADLWHCCKVEVVIGVANSPLAGHNRSELEQELESLREKGIEPIKFWLNKRERDSYTA